MQIKAGPIHIKPVLTDTDPNWFETCSLTDTNTGLQKQNNWPYTDINLWTLENIKKIL